MVLESLIRVNDAFQKPWKLIFYSFFITIFSLLLSIIVFYKYSSLIALVFIIIPLIALVTRVLRVEEAVDVSAETELEAMKHHRRAIFVLLSIFVGIIFGNLVVFVILPTNVLETLYSVQLNTIAEINSYDSIKPFSVKSFDSSQMQHEIYKDSSFSSNIKGSNINGNAVSKNGFFIIILNNIRVMIFCLIFSFLYSSGALFVLTWNASLISTAIGIWIRNKISQLSLALGFNSIANYFHIISLGLLRFFLHGILEITAYVIAALAGGIVSYAVINHHYKSKRFYQIIFDTYDLIILALIFIILSAIIEVYVSWRIV